MLVLKIGQLLPYVGIQNSKTYSLSDTAVTTSLRKPKKKAKWKMPTILNKIMGIYMSSR